MVKIKAIWHDPELAHALFFHCQINNRTPEYFDCGYALGTVFAQPEFVSVA